MRKALTVAIIVLLIQTMFLGLLTLNSHIVSGDTPNYGITCMTNCTWNMAGSPCWIEGNVYMDNGSTLTIDPGVVVTFNTINGDLGIIRGQ